MRPPDYTPADLRDALAQMPLQHGDVLLCHSNIGMFGRLEGAASAPQVCRAFCDAIFERIGSAGTLVVPAFTYSFPRGEEFDPATPIATMGTFSEWLRQQPQARRSLDPCYSVVAAGGAAEALTANAAENSFGDDSFFARFERCDGKILNLNFDAGSTYIHYVERCLRVPYRFDKSYSGTVRIGELRRPTRSTIWVRYLSDPALEAVFEPFDALARERGVYRVAPLGRGAVGCISARDTRELIRQTLPSRPWFLTRAEQDGVTQPRIEPEQAGGTAS